MSNEKLIKVTGVGKVSLPPDQTTVFMELTDRNKDYAKVVEASTKHTGEMKDALEKIGISRDTIKTLSFRVDVETESYQDDDHRWRERFVGYRAVHSAKFDFGVDNELLGAAMTALARMPFKPTFSVSYSVKEAEKARKTLLENAVKDAKNKAHVLAKAAGAKLGTVARIIYGDGVHDFMMEAVPRMAMNDGVMLKSAGALKVDINPDDITEEERVNVFYELIVD